MIRNIGSCPLHSESGRGGLDAVSQETAKKPDCKELKGAIMAHNLEIKNGQASMFYVGQPPWHHLGTQLERPAIAKEAIEAAKLNWQVTKAPLYVHINGSPTQVHNKYGVVRKDLCDTKAPPILGIVGEQYTPLQNSEAFDFFDPIVGKDAAVYHTAGVLGHGERIWILAKLPADIRVIGDDIVNKYLLLSNSHDGLSAVQVKFTPIRVVCQNTLTMALSQGPTIRIVHTKDMKQRLKQAEQLLGIVHTHYRDIEADFAAMTRVQVDGERLKEYLSQVFPDPKDPDNQKALKRLRDDRSLAEYFFDRGKGTDIKGVRGTLWAAYNGVAELIDHRVVGFSETRRLGSIWFGDGYLTKARAYKVAKEKMRAWQN